MFNFAHRLLQSRPLSPSQGPMVAWQPQIPPRSIRSGPPHQMASMFGLHRLCAKKDETGPTEPGYQCPLTTQTTSMEMSEIEDLYSAWRHFWGRIQGQKFYPIDEHFYNGSYSAEVVIAEQKSYFETAWFSKIFCFWDNFLVLRHLNQSCTILAFMHAGFPNYSSS